MKEIWILYFLFFYKYKTFPDKVKQLKRYLMKGVPMNFELFHPLFAMALF